MLNFLFDIYLTLPEIYIMVALLLLLKSGVLLGGSYTHGYPILSRTTSLISMQILIITFLLYLKFPYVSCSKWNNLFFFDTLSKSASMLFLLLLIVWVYFSNFYKKEEKINTFEYWILVLFCGFSLLLIFQIYDLLSLYLIIELQSLSFYILASYKRNSEFSTEAGLKYFVTGAFSSALLLLGCSFLYGLTGVTNFEDFNLLLISIDYKSMIFYSGSLLTGFIFICSSLLFKVGGAPFHMWVPDVYEGAPLITTSFFSIFPKYGIITLLIKLCFFSFNVFFNFWIYFFLLSSFVSLLVGSLGALMQNKLKRLFAYSSINHIGFILMGFLISDHVGLLSICIYLIIYIFTNYALFSLLMGLRLLKYPSWYQLRYTNELKNLYQTNPLLSFSITIILFSMAGIPPLGGFFAKVFVLMVSIQSNSYFIALIAVLLSCLAAFYYIRIIQLIYFSKIFRTPVENKFSKESSYVLSISTIFLLLFFSDIDLFYLPIKHFVLTSLM